MSSLQELLAAREVLLALVWREVKTRYRGSFLGFLWTLLNPLMFMAIYSLVFTVYLRMDIPAYPVFLFAGLLPWIWFASALVSGATSVIDGSSLIKRVAFSPLILPTVAVTANLVNFLLALPLLFVFMVGFGVPLTWAAVILPVAIAIQYVFTLGLTVILSMVTVRYRDLQHLLANLITLWLFVTPILYPMSMVPPALQAPLLLNPMTAIIGSYQDALYYGRFPSAAMLLLAASGSLALLAAALSIYARWRWVVVEDV
jgi:lipopolysaccharide transport system permease protein